MPKDKPQRTPEASGSNNQAAETFTFGSIYTGVVVGSNTDGTYTVRIEDPTGEITNVLPGLPVVGGLLGFKIHSNLSLNTKVKLVYSQPSVILAEVPIASVSDNNNGTRSLINGAPGGVGLFSERANDLVEGEFSIENLYGTGVDFLTSMMRLRAGDRAAVECYLINDMVRILSSRFQHFSGLGEETIFDHGRPTLERGWSSYRHEVLGALKERDELAEMNGDQVDLEKLEETRLKRLGRHRLVELIGFAGDFIHSFVTDPIDSLRNLTKNEAKHGSGKSWIHRNSDGSVIIQSVADIRLERVARIPVPFRYKHDEDPAITKAREYDKLNKDFLKLPEIDPTDIKDAFRIAYHIRGYGRWLTRFHSFSRLLQQQDEYEVPSEEDTQKPDWRNYEKDRREAAPEVSYYDSYAVQTILRDGSILDYDAWGSSIMRSNGNVQIAAARHLDLEAAGDIRVKCGGSFLLKAFRNIEFSATVGGLILHGYAWLQLLCERGSIWGRSGAKTDPSDTQEPKDGNAENPAPLVAGWVANDPGGNGAAILFEATEGRTVIRSEKAIDIVVDGTPEDENDTRFNITFYNRGDLDMRSKRRAVFAAAESISVSTSGDLALGCTAIASTANTCSLGGTADKPQLLWRGGILYAQNIQSLSVNANRVASRSGNTFQLSEPVERPEVNDSELTELLSSSRALSQQLPVLMWPIPTAGPTWSFPQQSEYVWDIRERIAATIPETVTQQTIRVDSVADQDFWGGNGWVQWNMNTQLDGKRLRSKAGFGSFERKAVANTTGEQPGGVSSTAPKNMELPEFTWEAESPLSIFRLKRKGE